MLPFCQKSNLCTYYRGAGHSNTISEPAITMFDDFRLLNKYRLDGDTFRDCAISQYYNLNKAIGIYL